LKKSAGLLVKNGETSPGVPVQKALGLRSIFRHERTRRQALATGFVVPDPARCVQCGICSYNCPIGIDIRRHAWLNKPIKDSRCLSCGECVARCPRGVLRFERTNLFNKDIFPAVRSKLNTTESGLV